MKKNILTILSRFKEIEEQKDQLTNTQYINELRIIQSDLHQVITNKESSPEDLHVYLKLLEAIKN